MRHFYAVLFIGCAAVPFVACGDDGLPRTYECHCTYFMDTDVPGTIDVAVCVAGTNAPEPRASECAQGQGVGTVDKCTCIEQAHACTLSEACTMATGNKPLPHPSASNKPN